MSTQDWWSGGQRWLTQQATKMAAAQKQAWIKRGRSAKTFRYDPPQWHRDAVAALGRNDEETFKAIKLDQLGTTGLPPLRKASGQRHHATVKKTKAQLDADIAASLAKRGNHGKTGTRTESGRCSECGASGFTYNNGHEVSASGVRGYRCMSCGTIKPERAPAKSGRAHATVKTGTMDDQFNPRGQARLYGAPDKPVDQARDVLTRAGYEWRSVGPIARRYIREHGQGSRVTGSKARRSHATVKKDDRDRCSAGVFGVHHCVYSDAPRPVCHYCGQTPSVKGGKWSHATIKKNDRDWDSFTDGAAFAFWASPYMTEVDNVGEDSREAYKALAPGSGGKWEDVLPPVPAAAKAVAKKFTKAVREKLTDADLDDVFSKFNAYSAGYKGAMSSQGEGVGWYDEGVRVQSPRGFEGDPKVSNAAYAAVKRGLREAGVKMPRR